MTAFVAVAHLVGCLFFSFFLFFGGCGGGKVKHTHLLVSTRGQTAEIRAQSLGVGGGMVQPVLMFTILHTWKRSRGRK